MRTRITIVFETHGTDASGDRVNTWNRDLSEKIADVLQLTESDGEGGYTLITFDIVSVERLAEEPE
jgi:hypothetical protein